MDEREGADYTIAGPIDEYEGLDDDSMGARQVGLLQYRYNEPTVSKDPEAMATCLFCMAAPADLGRYCSGCYGRVFHEDGSPLVLGDPADPWREFNAEADRTMADAKALRSWRLGWRLGGSRSRSQPGSCDQKPTTQHRLEGPPT